MGPYMRSSLRKESSLQPLASYKWYNHSSISWDVRCFSWIYQYRKMYHICKIYPNSFVHFVKTEVTRYMSQGWTNVQLVLTTLHSGWTTVRFGCDVTASIEWQIRFTLLAFLWIISTENIFSKCKNGRDVYRLGQVSIRDEQLWEAKVTRFLGGVHLKISRTKFKTWRTLFTLGIEPGRKGQLIV